MRSKKLITCLLSINLILLLGCSNNVNTPTEYNDSNSRLVSSLNLPSISDFSNASTEDQIEIENYLQQQGHNSIQYFKNYVMIDKDLIVDLSLINKCRLNGLSKVNQTSYPAMQIWPQEKVHNKLKFYMYFDVNEHRNWYYSLLSGMYGWATAFERNGGSKWAPFIGTNDPNSADIDIYIADLGPIDPTIPSGLTYILPDGSRAIKSIIILNQNYENYAYLKDERLFIATHELGHALSLNHTEAGAARQIAGTPQEDIKSIMVPTFNLDETTDYESYLPLVQIPYKYEYVVPSENDIKALRILYDL